MNSKQDVVKKKSGYIDVLNKNTKQIKPINPYSKKKIIFVEEENVRAKIH